jgi:zinc protease
LLSYEYYGYPQDFLFRLQTAIKTTTVQDIQRVAKKYLKPENIVTLVVGNQATIQPPLNQLANEVKQIDIKIPGQ